MLMYLKLESFYIQNYKESKTIILLNLLTISKENRDDFYLLK